MTLCLSCSRGQPKKGPVSPSLRLAVVTDLKGYLEPCGCTSDPLGGIDRLAAQIRTLREGPVPVVLLIAGDTFFDAAELKPVRVDQASRNAKTLAGILNGLEVTAVLPGRRDRAQPAETLEALRKATEFPWLAMTSDAEVLRIEAGALRLNVVGVRPGSERDAVAAALETVQAESDLTIALVDGSRRDANRIGAIASPPGRQGLGASRKSPRPGTHRCRCVPHERGRALRGPQRVVTCRSRRAARPANQRLVGEDHGMGEVRRGGCRRPRSATQPFGRSEEPV
ncbi:MAG: hypothetical protein JRF42_05420 [Deltaproteobacteria bacterium]|nr:hypothetical protein [Deltaproteobacteria bacterium]